MGVAMEFIIRESVTDQDKYGKAYVHYTAWNETYTGLMPQGFLDGRSLEKCIKNAYEYPKNTFVAVAEEKVVGFALYIPESRELVGIKPSSEVVAIYVLQKYQRNGIGEALLKQCIKVLPRNPIAIFVLKGNEKAINFYKKQGFKFTGKTVEQNVKGGTLVELEMVLER